MGSRELLEKVVQTSSMTGGSNGGLLNPKQSNQFIDYVVEQSVLIADARLIRMSTPQIEIDKITIGKRIMAKATEATDTSSNTDPTFSKLTLTTVKLRLDWELSTEGLEDNIEGDSLEDHVASLMARQTANDLEDLYIQGDTTSGNALLKALDGFRKLARANAHVVDVAGANLTRSTFDRALRNLPNKYLQRRSQLSWYTSSSLLQDYIWSLTLTNPGLDGTGASAPGSVFGDQLVNTGFGGATGGAIGNNGLRPFGIPLKEVPLMEETETGTYSAATGNHGVVELTFPENRVIGVQRDIVVYREFKPKKDTIEYTQFVRVAAQIENPDSYVHVRNVKVRSL